jgi:hypothetical protein
MSQQVALKIMHVMRRIGAVKKTERHQTGYNYQSIDEAMNEIRPLMADVGLVVIPSIVDSELQPLDGAIPRRLIKYEYLLIDADSGESVTVGWQADPVLGMFSKDGRWIEDDKAMGKGHTYALKYFLLRLFLVSSKDDVDTDQNVHEPAPARNTAPTERPQQAPQLTGDSGVFITDEVTKALTRDGKKTRYLFGSASTFKGDMLKALFGDLELVDGTNKLPAPVKVAWERNGDFINAVGVELANAPSTAPHWSADKSARERITALGKEQVKTFLQAYNFSGVSDYHGTEEQFTADFNAFWQAKQDGYSDVPF